MSVQWCLKGVQGQLISHLTLARAVEESTAQCVTGREREGKGVGVMLANRTVAQGGDGSNRCPRTSATYLE